MWFDESAQEAGSAEAEQAAKEAAGIVANLSSQLDAWDMRMLLGGQFDDKARHLTARCCIVQMVNLVGHAGQRRMRC